MTIFFGLLLAMLLLALAIVLWPLLRASGGRGAASRGQQANLAILREQMALSALPRPDEFLVELCETLDGSHLFLYPFAGRLVHEGLAVLLALRLARARPTTFAISMNDYGIELMADRGFDFAPTFSIWTVIEECLNPPVVWERDRGWFTTPPFSEPEVFRFPGGIGDVECVNVEHEEVLLVPRWIDCERVTFKYGLGDEFINVLQVLHQLGLDSTDPVGVRGTQVAPRDVVAACLPDPATLGDRIEGRTCAGTWVTGVGADADGKPSGEREVYLYHVVDNAETMGRDGAQAVVWQTAVGPVVACELIDAGVWSGAGVMGPEALPPRPFLDLLAGEYDSPWGIEERTPG